MAKRSIMILLAALLSLLVLPMIACAQPETPEAYTQEALAAVSGLPVISIYTDSGELPGEEDLTGTLIRYIYKGGAVIAEEMDVEINERGNTSRRFPKKSYRVKILDDQGEKMNFALAPDLRSDDDWILNPMYADTSKVREALAYELWDAMNSSGVIASSSRVSYAEVYLNGEYWGLYGLQERIDRKQVSGNKRTGILYKVFANYRPTVEELLACEDPFICQGFELEFAGADVLMPWAPAAGYMALLDKQQNVAPARLSLENAIDYGLWAMLTQAHDCHFKNQYIHCVYTPEGYQLYKIPWDLNNTFGDIYKNDAQDTNYTRFAMAQPVMDEAFQRLIDLQEPAVFAAIQKRWQALRSSVITQEQLIARAHALHDPLFEAIERDSIRWPQGGMGEGNAVNIRDIESYIREMIPRMDAYIASLP